MPHLISEISPCACLYQTTKQFDQKKVTMTPVISFSPHPICVAALQTRTYGYLIPIHSQDPTPLIFFNYFSKIHRILVAFRTRLREAKGLLNCTNGSMEPARATPTFVITIYKAKGGIAHVTATVEWGGCIRVMSVRLFSHIKPTKIVYSFYCCT